MCMYHNKKNNFVKNGEGFERDMIPDVNTQGSTQKWSEDRRSLPDVKLWQYSAHEG